MIPLKQQIWKFQAVKSSEWLSTCHSGSMVLSMSVCGAHSPLIKQTMVVQIMSFEPFSVFSVCKQTNSVLDLNQYVESRRFIYCF
jgi:hypothetical protein